MEYDTVVGLEIHLELKTKTKMFSGAPYAFKDAPNSDTNEVDLAMPGTLPCVNEEAVKMALMACTALHLTIDPLIRFDRKNYYYSDLPKGFQITQQFHPIGRNGYLEFFNDGAYKKIRINRIHMEEDTAKQFHLFDESLIDYNRAGVPLVELVSEPDLANGLEAVLYLEKLRQILDYLNVSDVKMEEGSMRCDVNVSIKPKGSKVFGTKVEIKNLNSINNVKVAIDYEVQRQKDCLAKGEKIIQETRRFDEKTETTQAMRKKEGNVDYKYFPEPNIFPIRLSEAFIKEVQDRMPELPDQKFKRYVDEYHLKPYDANVIIGNKELCYYFDEVMKHTTDALTAAHLLSSDLNGHLSKLNRTYHDCPIKAEDFAALVNMLQANQISSKQGKEVLEKMLDGSKPQKIVDESGYKQVSDTDAIYELVKAVLDDNPQSISDFKNGKDRALGFLVGQVMKRSKGQANPKIANELVREELAKR